jgi:hypothetical protein
MGSFISTRNQDTQGTVGGKFWGLWQFLTPSFVPIVFDITSLGRGRILRSLAKAITDLLDALAGFFSFDFDEPSDGGKSETAYFNLESAAKVKRVPYDAPAVTQAE